MNTEDLKIAVEVFLNTRPNWDEDDPKCPQCWIESTPAQLKRKGVCRGCQIKNSKRRRSSNE